MRRRRILAVAIAAAMAVLILGCGRTADLNVSSAATTAPAKPASSSALPATPASATSTSTTRPLEPILTQLPPIALDDLALVQIGTGYVAGSRTHYGFPLRVLSPVGDAATVRKLIAAYEVTKLQPDRGFPQLQDPPVYLDFVMKDGSYIDVQVGSESGEVAVGHWAKGLAEGGSASPHSYASSPELAGLARSLVKASAADSISDAALPAEMPQDFRFVLAYGPGGRSVVDTFSGTFTKDLIRNPDGSTATARLELSNEDMTTVYEIVAGMDIAAYPADYLPTRLPNPDIYYFRLRVGSQEKEIYWADDRQSTSPDAVALRALFRRIRTMVEATPEYRSLPQAVGGYS